MNEPLWFLPHAFLIELVQFVFAHVGLVANIITVFYAFGDITWVWGQKMSWSAEDAEYRQFASRRNLREEWNRLAMNIIFASIGWVSIINVPPGQSAGIAEDLSFQLAYVRVALTGASIFLTFKSVKDLTDRFALKEKMRERDDKRRRP
jgi:hypothetical protein